MKFPQFFLSSCSDWKKTMASKKLRAALQKGEAVGETRYYIIVPADNEHQNHVLGEIAGFCQPMDDRLRRRISELVMEGLEYVPEIKRQLDMFVTCLFPDSEIPDRSNRRFYPKADDIRNCVYKELLRNRPSEVALVNVYETRTQNFILFDGCE